MPDTTELTRLLKALRLSVECRDEIAEAEERARKLAQQGRDNDAWDYLEEVSDLMRRGHWRLGSEILWRSIRQHDAELARKLEELPQLIFCKHCHRAGRIRLKSFSSTYVGDAPEVPGEWCYTVAATCEECATEVVLDFVDELPEYAAGVASPRSVKEEDTKDET